MNLVNKAHPTPYPAADTLETNICTSLKPSTI